MVMLNRDLNIKWITKYSNKQQHQMSPGTLNWYKWCESIGRRDYLKKSKEKTKRFERNNPGNLNFRVFKSTVLKDKKITNKVLMKFQKLIENTKSASGSKRNRHLKPYLLYKKMKKELTK